jgi:predicted metal-dependent HD superfamily phosphohydrolase
MDSLVKPWSELASRLGLGADKAAPVWIVLSAAYSEPHRHYHTLTHISDITGKFDVLRDRFEKPESVLLALFFHDIVYDPARQDNEAQSAALLCDRLPDIDGAVLNHACFCILESKGHKATGDADTDLFLDLDMSILGAPWEDYLRYAQGVAREYLPVFGAEAYAAGRPNLFLEPTLSSGHIFLTEPFQPLETQARHNLSAELDLWRSGRFSELLPPID